MKLVPVTVVGAAFVLSMTPMAVAKDLTKAQVCGQSGCAALPRDENGDGLIQLRGSEGRQVVAAPKAAPYYKLVWEFGPPGDVPVRFATLYVPSADLVAAEGMKPGQVEWFAASESVLVKVRDAARGLEPFAAPKRWPAEILAATPVTPTASPAPASDGRDWWGWAFGAPAVLVLIGSAAFFVRRRGVPRLLHRSFSGW